MSELDFMTILRLERESGKHVGTLDAGGQSVTVSGPAVMGGAGIGANPEELLAGAVSTCYGLTLSRILAKSALPWAHVEIEAEVAVTGFPSDARIARLTVSPTIVGGDPARTAGYEHAARTARDRCFIGRHLHQDLTYAVGSVTVRPAPAEVDAVRENA